MNAYGLLAIAAVFFAYSLVSKRLSTTFITGPIIFVTFGLIAGPDCLGLFEMGMKSEMVQLLLEATLVVVLFTDAMAINSREWRKEAPITMRLLGIGLPLTIVLGIALAMAMFTELGIWEAALVGAILAPTDAALGQSVISNPRVPQRIRHGLNVESGLNDGIVLPLVMIFIAAAEVTSGSDPSTNALLAIVKQVVLAGAVGVVVGLLGGKAIDYFSKRGWISRTWRQIGVLASAVFAYGLATPLGASGFIAAWVAGFTLGLIIRDAVRDGFSEIRDFGESTGYVLTMISFLVFGGVFLGPALGDLTWKVVLYALLSLTVLRIIPVTVSMTRSGLKWPSVLYMGWFGPRGLTSIIFAEIIIVEANLPGVDLIVLIMAITVGLSVYLHGMTAWAGSNRYANWYEGHAEIGDELKESKPVYGFHPRRRTNPFDR